jgi:hypothetical protein
MSEQTFEGLDTPETLEAPVNEASADATPAESSSAAEAPKAHPAHEKLLAELPEAWHAKVTPYLQEFDRNVQQQLEKYTPYKQFVEEGVDPNYILQSIQLAKAIAQDPITVHTNLTNALMDQGLLRADAEKAAQEIIDENEGEPYEDAELTPAMRRELERRDAELEAIKEQLSAQDFEKATEVELQKLNKEFTDLKGAYDISEKQEQAILELLDAAVARGEDLTVFQAAKKLVDITGVGFKKKGAAVSSSTQAPTVLGGSGGNGVPFEGVEIPKDDKAKRAMLAELFKNNLGRN